MGKQEEYDEIDKRIEEAITQKVEVPESFERAMREALFSEKFYKRLRKRKIIRTVTTACASVILTSGVAIGGFIAYEKIWKEPRQYTYQELENTIAKSDVSEEEKESLISEDEAKKNTLEILENLGYLGEEVKNIELKQNNQEGLEEIYYLLETNNNQNQNLKIKIDAKTGELKALENSNILQEKIETQQITEQQAKDISTKICEDIRFDEDDVEIESCQEDFIKDGYKLDLWNTTYMKKYNNVINPYEKLVIRFWVDDNKVKISSIYTESTSNYENNPMVISSEEAIEIAKSKEKEFTQNSIDSVESVLGIRKLNTNIIELEEIQKNINEKDENTGIYQQEIMARNVWMVKILHNKNSNSSNELQRLRDKSKIYYIDITTGEIIGGELIV